MKINTISALLVLVPALISSVAYAHYTKDNKSITGYITEVKQVSDCNGILITVSNTTESKTILINEKESFILEKVFTAGEKEQSIAIKLKKTVEKCKDKYELSAIDALIPESYENQFYEELVKSIKEEK